MEGNYRLWWLTALKWGEIKTNETTDTGLMYTSIQSIQLNTRKTNNQTIKQTNNQKVGRKPKADISQRRHADS